MSAENRSDASIYVDAEGWPWVQNGDGTLSLLESVYPEERGGHVPLSEVPGAECVWRSDGRQAILDRLDDLIAYAPRSAAQAAYTRGVEDAIRVLKGQEPLGLTGATGVNDG